MNILEYNNIITGIICWTLIISILLFNDHLKKKHNVDAVSMVDSAPVLVPLAGMALLWSWFKKINNKKYSKVKVIVIGPRIISEDSKKVTFQMLASRTGKNKGVIYESENYTALSDDAWLNGEINGLEILALVHKSNPQKYKLNFDNVTPSQYS